MRIFLAAAAVLALCGCESLQTAFPATTATAQPAAISASAAGERELLEVERRLSGLAQQSGLGGALSTVIDPIDGVVIRPGVTLQGPEAVAQGLPQIQNGPVFWQPDRVVVSTGGDRGMTSGRYVQVVPGAEAQQGRYVIVWRKDTGGEWRALSETRTADPPLVRAPAPPARPVRRR